MHLQVSLTKHDLVKHKIRGMKYFVRIELTYNGPQTLLANHYTVK